MLSFHPTGAQKHQTLDLQYEAIPHYYSLLLEFEKYFVI